MLFDKLKKLKKYDPVKEQELYDEIQANGGLEKNDMKAMIIAAMITILPFALAMLLILVLGAWLIL